MKASIKFRDEQKPLLRAKVPLNILGMPFQSGIVAGETKELTLNLATLFDSGPSLKLAYRPNDSFNPFSLLLKTGTGSFGSPFSSSMLMTCELNLLANRATGNRNNNGISPVFMLHFKPRFGDFSFKKSQSSIFDGSGGGGAGGSDDEDNLVEVVDLPAAEMGGFAGGGGKFPMMLRGDSPAAGAIAGLFSGVEVAARTKMPLFGRAAVKCRWGVRVPAEMKMNGKMTAGIAFRKVPFLVMDKIGVEHVVDGGSGDSAKGNGKGKGVVAGKLSDTAEACLMVKRQMEVLQAENGLLRKAVENLHREFSAVSGRGGGVGLEFGKYREFEKNAGKGKISDGRKSEKKSSLDFDGFPGKSTEADAMTGATGA